MPVAMSATNRTFDASIDLPRLEKKLSSAHEALMDDDDDDDDDSDDKLGWLEEQGMALSCSAGNVRCSCCCW